MTENGDENGHYHNAIIWLESPQYNNAMGYRWMEESPAVSRGEGGSQFTTAPSAIVTLLQNFPKNTKEKPMV